GRGSRGGRGGVGRWRGGDGVRGEGGWPGRRFGRLPDGQRHGHDPARGDRPLRGGSHRENGTGRRIYGPLRRRRAGDHAGRPDRDPRRNRKGRRRPRGRRRGKSDGRRHGHGAPGHGGRRFPARHRERAGVGGVAVGRHGAAAGGRGGAVATGPGGTVAARRGTYYVSGGALRTQGTYVRTNFRYYNSFTPAWYARYPRAWRAARWFAATAWMPATWAGVSGYCSYPATPVYYDYGTSVVYQEHKVYINGEQAATAEQYAQQQITFSDAGRAAEPSEKEEWKPLGVFALVRGEEQTSDKIFQLAVNKDGEIRGNYYDAFADNTLPVYGSVDKKTQRAAWSVGEKKDV